MRLVLLATLRFSFRNPSQLLLGLLGVGLGIGSVVAIDTAIHSSEAALDQTLTQLNGRATHQIRGGEFGLPENLYRTLRLELGFREMAPIIEQEVRVVAPESGILKLFGVDIYAESDFRSWGRAASDDFTRALVTEPRAVVMSRARAQGWGLKVGDSIEIEAAGSRTTLRIVGLLASSDPSLDRAYSSILLADLATAQEVLNRCGRLTRIDLRLEGDPKARGEIESYLGPELVLEASSRRRESLAEMTRAFRLNLRLLSLFALVVGWFLIENTLRFSVIRRREIFGQLRLLGVTRRQILNAVMLDSLTLAILGSLLGVVSGWLFAQGLTDVVVKTLGDLYFNVEVTNLRIDPWTLAKVPTLALGASLLAAWGPAREASRVEPRQSSLRSQVEVASERTFKRRGIYSLIGLAGAALLFVWPSDSLVVGYALLFVVLLSYANLIPPLVDRLTLLAGRLSERRSFVLKLGLRGIRQNLSRTGFAISALAVALSMSTGITVMVRSFRGSVVEWLGDQVTGDIFISYSGTVARQGNRVEFDPEFVEAVTGLDEVRGAELNLNTTLRSEFGAVDVVVKELDRVDIPDYRFVGTTLSRWPESIEAPAACFVSEPFASRHELEVGETLELKTPVGVTPFRVEGIFRDYASDLGYVLLARAVFDRYWDHPGVTALALYARESVDPAQVLPAVERIANERLGQVSGLNLLLGRDLYESTLKIFDRTFRVTDALKLISILVAVVGIVGAFLSLQIARSREFSVLRAIGVTPRDVGQLVVVQSLGMGLLAAILAWPLGCLFAVILTEVVNERSFGWSLDLRLSAYDFVEVVALSLVAALIASVYPALRIALQPLEAGLRMDE